MLPPILSVPSFLTPPPVLDQSTSLGLKEIRYCMYPCRHPCRHPWCLASYMVAERLGVESSFLVATKGWMAQGEMEFRRDMDKPIPPSFCLLWTIVSCSSILQSSQTIPVCRLNGSTELSFHLKACSEAETEQYCISLHCVTFSLDLILSSISLHRPRPVIHKQFLVS